MRRHINLLIEDLSKVELDELLEICKTGNYNFQFKCIKKRGIMPLETDYKLEDIGKVEFEKGVTSAPLFYFSILLKNSLLLNLFLSLFLLNTERFPMQQYKSFYQKSY